MGYTMNRLYQIYIALAMTIVAIFVIKISFEYNNIQRIKHMSVEYEAKALADLVVSFRETYQNIFIKNHTKIDENTFNFLPVRTINEISNIFSKYNADVTIKTVSDNPRNPLNLANKRQMEAIDYFKNNDQKEIKYQENRLREKIRKILHVPGNIKVSLNGFEGYIKNEISKKEGLEHSWIRH